MNKSSRKRWTEYVACMGEKQVPTKLWQETLKEKDHYENLGADGRIILN
jgi:hypothetical protein